AQSGRPGPDHLALGGAPRVERPEGGAGAPRAAPPARHPRRRTGSPRRELRRARAASALRGRELPRRGLIGCHVPPMTKSPTHARISRSRRGRSRRTRKHHREDLMAHGTLLRARFILFGATVILAAGAFSGTHVALAKTTLTVYTAVEADDLKKYAARFNEDHPDIEIKWVRDSTGVVTAKLLAEKANPQADVIWGLAATSLLVLKPEGLLLPYAPKGVEKLDAQFRDKDNPPAWVGMDAWVAAICFNTVEAQKKNLPKPASWKDLTKPVYKGAVVMPNPASSGTGFLDVTSWLQLFGEAEGWKYMDALHQNIGVYTHSGSKPCTMAGAGEYPIGVSFEFRAARQKK